MCVCVLCVCVCCVCVRVCVVCCALWVVCVCVFGLFSNCRVPLKIPSSGEPEFRVPPVSAVHGDDEGIEDTLPPGTRVLDSVHVRVSTVVSIVVPFLGYLLGSLI